VRRISPCQPEFRHHTWNVGWNMMCTPTPLAKFETKVSFGRVLWHRRLRYSALFGAPVLPARARSLMHTILSAPLHPHFGSYLPGWVTHTHDWHEYICHSLFGPCACAHCTAAPARESMRKYYGCMHVSSCAGMPVYFCVLCLLLCIDDKGGKGLFQ